MRGAKSGLTPEMRAQLTTMEERRLLEFLGKLREDSYSNDTKFPPTEEQGHIWFHDNNDCIFSSRMDGALMGYLAALGFDVDGKRDVVVVRDSLPR